MADKRIVWEVKIGDFWVEVCEKTFVDTMSILCDYVNFCEGKTRFAVFFDEYGYPVGKMHMEEV